MTDWMGAEDHVQRALEHYERGRWAEAEAELRKALSVRPDRGEWQFNLGLTLEAAGRDAEALDCYRRAAALLPGEADPLLASGAAAQRLARHEEAVELFEQAVRARRDDDFAHALWIESLLALDRLDEAETVFFLAQQSIDECPRSLAAVAEAMARRGDWARAEWCVREAMRLEPGLPRLRARLAGILAATGRPERAVPLFWRELREDPGCIETLLEFGALLERLERLPEAAERYRRVLELEPANVEAHRRLGRLAMRAGRHAEAQLELELATKLDPDTPGTRVDLAECLVELDRPDAAAQVLVAELDAIAQQAEGMGEQQGGRPTEVDAAAHERIGRLLLRCGRAVEAVRVLATAVAASDSLELRRLLAVARFESDDLLGGAAESRRVLRRDPRCKRSCHNLGLACLRLGQLRLAAAWVRRGLEIDRHDDGLRRLRARIWVARVAAWFGVRAAG